ncbi:MAG: conjugative transposon protein TraM [Bdellovibrionaceae bacterium]|jgi:hypothetical protein|nr:conjugative transposon protein TraM [Pseudobdellovibrionaceae bacterium]
MSSDEVEIIRDKGYKTQWAKGLFYRKEGNKFVFKSEKLKGALIVISVLGLCVLVLQDNGTQTKKDTSIQGASNISGYAAPIVIDLYNEIKAKAKVKKRVYKVERLSLVSRKGYLDIPLGSQARARLMTGASNGPVKAQLLEDLEYSGEVFIKEGTILWGKGTSTTERLMVSFSKYVGVSGQAINVSANAYDNSDQIIGLKGSAIGRMSKKIMAGAGIGVASALKTMQKAENLGGIAVVKPSLENALLNGAADATLSIAEQEFEELKNKQTIIEVKKGTEILVVFGKE